MSVTFLKLSEPFALGVELKEIELSPKSDESKGMLFTWLRHPSFPLKSAFSPLSFLSLHFVSTDFIMS